MVDFYKCNIFYVTFIKQSICAFISTKNIHLQKNVDGYFFRTVLLVLLCLLRQLQRMA